MEPTAIAVFEPSLLFSPSLLMGALKILFLIGLGVYGIFALVVVRQVAIMTKTIKTGAEWFFTILAYAHLALALVVWWMAFVSL